jgi:hypothetical protein
MNELIQLLKQFDITSFLTFTIVLALAAKGVIIFFDWVKERLMKMFNKQTKKQRQIEQLRQQEKSIKELKSNMESIQSKMNLLIESDKDDIKAWITEKHHFYCYRQKYIDDYTLDCLEKRFSHYEVEGGNSFVHNLMEELRALPKKLQ